MIDHKEVYKSQFEEWEGLPVFFKPWYLEAICGENDWDVCISKDKGGRIEGVMPYYKSKKYGIPHITMPLLAPYLGPWLIYPLKTQKLVSKYSFEKKVISNLLSQLPDVSLIKMHLHPSINNVLPSYWAGYETHVRYTYIVNSKEEGDLWTALDSKQRNIISTAQNKFQIVMSEDIDQFYNLNCKSFTRNGGEVLYDRNYIVNIYNALKENNAGKILFSKDENDQTHAGILLVKDHLSTYCLAIGNDPRHKNSGSLSHLMWHCVRTSLEETESFNFEGGMIPNIEKFFRSFGGELTPYYRIQKTKNKFLKGIFAWTGKL